MVRISVHLTQSPLVLHPRHSRSAADGVDLASFTGNVAVTTSKRKVIHGIEVVWLVCHQRRKDAKEKWGPATRLEEYRVTVSEGEYELGVGTTR